MYKQNVGRSVWTRRSTMMHGAHRQHTSSSTTTRSSWESLNYHLTTADIHFHELTGTYMNLYELSGTYRTLLELKWTHLPTLSYTKVHKLTWTYTNPHELTWTHVNINEVICAYTHEHTYINSQDLTRRNSTTWTYCTSTSLITSWNEPTWSYRGLHLLAWIYPNFELTVT
jgi:hypothetical protein